MRPYYFDFDRARTRRSHAILTFERAARGGWPPLPPRRRLTEFLHEAAALLRPWRTRIRDRRELTGLDQKMQRDIGITPSEIANECNKPFWEA
jgi:uncharacterized protein YjiS (DUF1127 family)